MQFYSGIVELGLASAINMEKAVQELMGITIFCFDILAISTVFR
jgi:hypothetical protein